MVRWTRSARIAPGKFIQGVQWAKEIAEFVNKKYKIQVTVYMDSFGEAGTIRWFADYENLAALDKLGDKIFADQEYFKKLNQAADLFQAGYFDTVMRAI